MATQTACVGGVLTFQRLWKNHPTITGESHPCSTNGKPNYADQCAIRMGVCLVKSGVDTTKIHPAARCPFHARSAGHIRMAEELAKGLTKYRVCGLAPMEKVAPANFQETLKGKSGIIFFKDYWVRKGESYAKRSGDHIDLWNGSRLTDWFSWARIHVGHPISRLVRPEQHGRIEELDASDYSDSKEVWFWLVKG